MRNRRPWIVATAGLIVLWGGVWVVAMATRGIEHTPESVLAFLREQPGDSLTEANRAALVDELAYRVNRLTPKQRMDADLGRALRDRFAEMSDAEKSRYLDLTLPRGFEQMMQVVNAMTREERKALVDEAMQNLERDVQERPEELNDAQTQRIVDEGMRSYLSDASAEAKLDLQPLISRMQQVLRETP